jgi:hypothetical protein
MRLMDAEAQLAHHVYERVNVVDAGFADTCDGVPGQTLSPVLWKGRGIEVARPAVYVGKARGDVLRLTPGPAPLLLRAFGGDVTSLVHHTRRLEKEAARAVGAARGFPARTASQVRAIEPWSEATSPREPLGERVPAFKTGLAGEEGRLARIYGAEEVRAFRAGHRGANDRWRGGDRKVAYPFGTYEMRRFHGVRVDDVRDGAWVTAPGPTTKDVKRELAEGRVARDATLVERVRDAVLDAASGATRDEAEIDGEQPSEELRNEAGVTVTDLVVAEPPTPRASPAETPEERAPARGSRGDPPCP